MYLIKLFIMISLFKTIGSIEAVQSIRKNNGKEIHEFLENLATGYDLNNGKFIVLPENGDSALFFENKKDFDDFIKHPDFPAPCKQPFFDYRNNIKNIEESMSFFMQTLNQELHLKLQRIETKDDLKLVFDTLNDYIKNDNDFYLKVFVPLGVMIGDYLTAKTDLKWELSPVYTFQPYMIPILRDTKKIELPIWSILEEYYEGKKFDLDNFVWKLRYNNILW